MNFTDKVDQLRKQKGITTKQMLEDCKLNRNAMHGWKQGSIPRPATLKVLADYFNVPVSYFDDASDDDYTNEELISDSSEGKKLTQEERLILDAYRSATTEGKFKIIQICMNMRK